MKINNRKLISPALYDGSCGLRKRDWALFIILAVICYFSFAQGDLYITGNRSWLYWTPGGWDFYERSFEFTDGYGANYMPSTFVLFALWVLPLKLLGLPQPPSTGTSWVPYTMWYKLLPVLFYIASAYLLYRVCLLIGMKQKKSLLCMYAFMSMPVAFYSQFIFSQYDIFTVFFMLLGIYYYFRNSSRKDYFLFCLFFGIATTFKYFAILIFFVLLLLDEKRVGRLILWAVVAICPLLAEVLLYWHSESFHRSVFGFTAVGYTAGSDFSTIIGSYSFFKIACCFLVAWPYFVHPKDKQEKVRWALYFCCGICFAIFTFITWHPQWFIFVAPFWVMSAFINKHLEKFLWLDTAFILVFYAFILNAWHGGIDEVVLGNGIWRDLLGNLLQAPHDRMGDFVSFIDKDTLYSAIAVFLIIFFVFKHPRNTLEDFSEPSGETLIPLLHLRVVATAGAFILLAGLSMFSAYQNRSDIVFAPSADEWVGVMGDNTYEQNFTGSSGTLDSILVKTVTYGRSNTVSLTVELVNTDTDEVLAVSDTSQIANIGYTEFDLEDLVLDANTHYQVRIYSTGATSEDCYGIGVANTSYPDTGIYGTLNGENGDFDVCIALRMKS